MWRRMSSARIFVSTSEWTSSKKETESSVRHLILSRGNIGKVRSFDTQGDCALARMLIRCVISFAARRTFLNRKETNFYGRYLVSNTHCVWELLLIGSIPQPAALPMTIGIIHLPSA